MSEWKNSICQNVGTERISNLRSYIQDQPLLSASPIDIFYNQTREIISFTTPEIASGNNWIGALHAIGLISCTENYLRSTFSKILKICCDSKKSAAEHSINFGSVIWHPNDEIERGAFEHISFSSVENILKASRKFLGIELNTQQLKPILTEFELICEMRHGIVHSDRVLAGKNGMKLKISPSLSATVIHINYARLQEIAAICTSLVVSLNKFFFTQISRRWATSWRESSSWEPKKESTLFKEIWLIFHSQIDFHEATIPTRLSWVKCRNKIKKEYDLY